MIHCPPVAERSRSSSRSGTAIATIVWSMNVIATANTMAASTRFLLATAGMGASLVAELRARVKP